MEERLLIGALDLPFEVCAARIREAGGLCVPAHQPGSSGVLGARWAFCRRAFTTTRWRSAAAPLTADVTGYRLLRSSDAHSLEQMLEQEFALEAETRSAWTRCLTRLRGGRSPIERLSSVFISDYSARFAGGRTGAADGGRV